MATAPGTVAPASMFELSALKKLYAEAKENTDQARKESELAQDYYDNKQWTSTQIKALRKRKQPEIWINRIAPAVNGILGVLEQGQTDPRAFPRNAEDQDAAEVATDALRYSAERSRWQRTKLAAAKNCLVGGIAAVIVEANQDGDPWPQLIRAGEFIYDPHSRDPDFEDARYTGVAKWMYVDIVKGLYPGSTIDPKDVAPASVAFDDEDKPANVWSDARRNRVLVVEIYIQRMGWKRVCFWGGGILEEGDSPYVDERGTPTNPIVAQSCFVDRDNARYGIVKAMVPIQDEINMSRSRGLHLLNSRQVRITDPNGPDVAADTIREEAARPDGILPFGVETVPNNDLSAGQMARMTESKAELERLGPNPAVLGRSNQDASGRAQLVRQQAGLTELTPALGGIEDLELRVYRQMWARIKQFWTEPKTIRVTDDIGAAKFLMVNEPQVEEVPAIVMGPDGQPVVGTQQVVRGVRNRPAEMDMDIIIDSVPDTANIQSEQFAELVRLAQVYGPQEVPFDDLLEASSLPKKRELIEKREARMKEAAQQQAGPDPAHLAAQQEAQAQAAAEMQKAEIKAQADVEIARIKADVDFRIAEARVEAEAQMAMRKQLLEQARCRLEAEQPDKAQAHQAEVMEQLGAMLAEMGRPRVRIPVRDENGLIVGIREEAA